MRRMLRCYASQVCVVADYGPVEKRAVNTVKKREQWGVDASVKQ
jgi:hypothetical protein